LASFVDGLLLEEPFEIRIGPVDVHAAGGDERLQPGGGSFAEGAARSLDQVP